MIVSSIRQTAPGRLTVTLESGEEIRTTLGVVTDRRLFTGRELDGEALAALRQDSARALARRAETYNRSLEEAKALETQGRLLILAPDTIEGLKTLSQDHGRLEALYWKGQADAERIPDFLAAPVK